MKKLSLLAILTLSVSVILCGCGKKKEDPAIEEVTLETQEYTPVKEAPQTEPTEESVLDDVPPEEGMVRSRLTNEWVSADVGALRPLAVMIPNDKSALPQYNISNADIVYECLVEGEITRLMAIYGDWTNLERVGNIRSCRDYFVYWAFEWDAIYIHYGGPFYIDDLIAREDTQNINCIDYANATFRDTAKNSTDNAFTSAERIKEAADYYGYPTEYREGYSDDNHFQFATNSEPNTLEQYSDAIDAKKIDMSPAYPVTNCYFVYNEETGLYERFQHLSGDSDGPHVDLATNEQLAFKNVLVQNTYFEVRDQKGYLAFQCHDTTRDGWFFTNGKGIHVTWEKTADYSATRYYDDDGNEIKLNTGKTMICILEDGDSFNVDDKVIEAD